MEAAAPWEVPRGDWLSQRLFNARFSTPEGNGRFKLTLRYSNPEQFQVSATDPLGRSLWSLYVTSSEALLLEHREKRSCSFSDELDLSSLYLGSFPVRNLPGLLLGRLPASPFGNAPLWTDEGDGAKRVRFEDEGFRSWSARLVSAEPESTQSGAFVLGLTSWTLREASGTLLAELERDGEWWVLADRRQDLELRWKQVVEEPLAGPVEIPPVPSRYRRGGCLPSPP